MFSRYGDDKEPVRQVWGGRGREGDGEDEDVVVVEGGGRLPRDEPRPGPH